MQVDKQHLQKEILANAVSSILKSWGLPYNDDRRNWYIAEYLLNEIEKPEAFLYLGR